MDGKQLRRDRERLRVSRTELALASGMPREEIAEWERSGASIPRPTRERIVASLSALHRERLLERCDLPECPWAAERGAAVEDIAEVRAHAAVCDLCRAQEQYVRRHGYVPLPSPVVAVGKVFRLLGTASMPSLALMAAGVVVILLGLARLFRHLPFFEPLVILLYPFALVLAAVVGLGVYTGLAPLHDWGGVGRWLARCVAATAAAVGFGSMLILSGYDHVISRHGDPMSWGQGIELGLVVGVVYASIWPLACVARKPGEHP